jgi:hypothetical protein
MMQMEILPARSRHQNQTILIIQTKHDKNKTSRTPGRDYQADQDQDGHQPQNMGTGGQRVRCEPGIRYFT